MITIYSNTITSRLNYILHLFFNDLLGIAFELTSDKEKFHQRTGPKISYAAERSGDEILICPTGLVFENNIKPQQLEIAEWEGMKIYYPTSSSADIPFDIFSASFLMVSRYKEYLPYRTGEINRFEATESLAFRHGFLEEPVINQWSQKLKAILQQRYPALSFPVKHFQFISTIDIDNAYAFKHKSFFRTSGALVQSLLNRDINNFLARIATLLGHDEDPYNTYGYIDQIEKKYGFTSLFFFLVGNYNRYDTNINIRNLAFRKLIKNIAADHLIGIHPSTSSNKNISILQKEISRLARVLEGPVIRSRQHFLIIELPTTYLRLLETGIREDYSMGYASHPGFRAGICTPFRFYNLLEEKETDLVIYPFQVMDVSLRQYMRLNPDEAIKKTKELMEKVKKVNGTFVTLWHNESLSDKGVWKGWRRVFEEVIRMGKEEGTSERKEGKQ
ncbi:MAG: polysaccharide deacetylase family protein [Bacteroidales bacterium]|nr:polysaccharide deacetylase family protein [Bacteroidales bacterium]